MIHRYDAEIAEVDHYIGKILYSLDQLGIDDKTMVIISSLHGESLGEHGYFFNHGGVPYHNLTHVPLMMHIPGSKSARIKDVVEGIDIMPTVLGYMSVKSGRETSGMSLLRFA